MPISGLHGSEVDFKGLTAECRSSETTGTQFLSEQNTYALWDLAQQDCVDLHMREEAALVDIC